MKKIMLVLLSVILMVSLVSCGAKDKAPEETGELKKITLVLDYVPNTNHTGIYVAQAKGFFEEEGLEVDVIQPPDEGAALLVASGGAQIGVHFQDLMAPAISGSDPLPISAVAAILQHNTSGIVSLKSAGIERPKDLEGKSYATWESPIELAMIKYVMEKDGADFEQLDVIPYTVTDTFSALETLADSVWIFYGWDGVQAELKDVDINYFDFASVDEALDYYTPVFIANNDFLSEEPETAKAVLRALKKGYAFAVEDPDAAADILLEKVPELDNELIHASQKWLADQYIADAPYWGYIDATRWDNFYQWLEDHELIETPIPAGFGFTNDYLEQ